MRLSFVGIDPDTPDGGCQAVFVDEDSGRLGLIGVTVIDPAELAAFSEHAPIADHETAVWVDPRMFEFIREAIRGDFERGRRGPGPH